MENLSFPIERLMFNTSLGVADVGLYADSKKGKNMLSFKKHGLNLQGIAGTTVPMSDSVKQVNTITLAGSTTEGHSVAIVVNGAGTTAAIPAAANNNVTKAANAYMTAYEATLLALGVVLTNPSAGVLVFTATTAGVPFTISAATLTGTLTATNVATTANVTAMATQAATIKSVMKTSTQAGTLSGGLITLSNVAPCITCDHSYHLNFRKEVQYPGQDNFETNEYMRYYGSTLANPVISGGIFDPASVLAMETELIKQIEADKGTLTSLVDKHDQAFVEARRFYIFDEDANTGSSITITWPDGTSTAITSGLNSSGSAAGKLAYDFNALSTSAYGSTVGGLLKMYRIGASKYMLTSINSGLLFTVALVANLTASTSGTTGSRGIYYKAIDPLVQAVPSMEQSFGSYELFSLASITATTGTHTVSGSQAGVQFSYTSAGSATSTTNFANINSANTLGYRYYAGQIVTGTSAATILIGIGVSTLNFKSTGAAVATWTCNGIGKWGYLTGDDVFRIFANRTNSMRPQWQRIDQPSAASIWFKYIITLSYANQPASVGGAGDRVTKEQTVELYVNQALTPGSTALYTAADATLYPKNWSYSGPNANADTTFEELLGIWSGVPIASWV